MKRLGGGIGRVWRRTRRQKSSLILGAALVTGFGSRPAAQAATIVDNLGGSVDHAMVNNRGYARGFTMGSTSQRLETIHLTMKSTDGAGSMTVQIWTDNNAGPHTKIDEEIFAANQSSSFATVTRSSPSNPTLAAGTKYWFVVLYRSFAPHIRRSAGATGLDGAVIHDNQLYQSDDGGSSWYERNTYPTPHFIAFALEGSEVLDPDYGDAPDTGAGTATGNYQTLAGDNGPSHEIYSDIFLGAQVDGESDAAQNSSANGDDSDVSPDDEDGLVDPTDLRLTEGAAPKVRVRVSNNAGSAGTLYGWIDYDGDGEFENATERASVSVPNGSSLEVVTLTFPTVPENSSGKTYARFRLSTDAAAADPTGAADDGEVEDYVVRIVEPSGGTVSSNVKISDGLGGFSPTELNATDEFGYGVAGIGDLNGDGVPDLAVGAFGDEADGSSDDREGAAYILFMNSDGTVASHKKIADGQNGFTSSLAAGDRFGADVASIGDLNGDGVDDLAIGAPGYNGNRGALYVIFMKTDGTVDSVTRIIDGESGFSPSPALDGGDQFGRSIANVGDLNGDGIQDLAVSAVWEEDDDLNDGGVYILFMNRDGTVASHTLIADSINGFTPAELTQKEYFGFKLASLGDLDGDGVTDIVVGAPHDEKEENGDPSEGAVYILFLKADGTVKSHVKISDGLNGFAPAELTGNQRFGESVAAIGDIDADGVMDIIVGADGDEASDGTDIDEGAAYILRLNSDGTVKSHVKISDGLNGFAPSGLEAGDFFGRSVAAIGDVNGDGIGDLAVGASADENGDTQEGAVYILFLGPTVPVVSVVNATVTVSEGSTAQNSGSFSAAQTVTASAGTITQGGGTFTWELTTGLGSGQNQTVTITAEDSSGQTATTTFDLVVEAGRDFGDAPDSTAGTGSGDYQTLLAHDGPRHTATGSTLGESRDAEFDATPNANADGDGEEEDGVRFSALAVGSSGTIVVNTLGGGLLNAWIDYDQDGVFESAEQIANDFAVANGDNNLPVTIPGTASSGNTYARFRLNSTGGLGATGAADDGEVEDYLITLGTAVDADSPGVGVGDGADSGGADSDQFLLTQDGSNNSTVSVDGNPASTFTAGSGGGVVINGSNDDDTLTIDFSNGNPFPAGGVTFNGGGGTDTVVIIGTGGVTLATYTFVNASDGYIDYDGSLFTYTGLEPIVDTIPVPTRVLNFSGGAEVITVTADGALTTIDSTLGESLTVSTPTSSMTINAGSGADTIHLNSLGSGWSGQTIAVNGDDGNDTVNLNRTVAAAAAIDAAGGADTDTLNYTDDGVAATDSGTQITSAGISTIDHNGFETVNIISRPEIVVHDGPDTTDTEISSGGSADVGTTTVGNAITKTFNIENTGTATLNVSGLSLPAGFSLSGAFPSSIAAGSSATFVVQLDADSTAGSFSGSLSFTTDDTDENPFSFTVSGTVNKGTPTVTITSDGSDPSELGAPYTVSVSVTGGGVTPTGTVTISDGEGNNNTITLSGGSGSANLQTSTAGAKTLSASYGGDGNYLTGSDTEPHSVNQGFPAVAITARVPNATVVGQSYTVAVSVIGTGVDPTGTVTISDGEGNSDNITLSFGLGSGTLTTSTPGTKTITANYAGDANYVAASGAGSHPVSKATPTVTITSDSPDPNNINQAVTVNFTVTPPFGGTPTGNVIVSDDSGQSVTVDVATGTATIDCLAVGNRTITAAYQGDSNFNAASDTEAHTVVGPDIVVLGNGIFIADGDTSPTTTDHTGYGNSGEYPYVVTRTYTIRNDGTDTLNLTGPSPVTLVGDSGPYRITQPATLVLGIGASTTFSITFAPEIAGPRDAVVHIASDSKPKEDFDFAITGMIIPSAIDTTYNPGVGPNRKVQDVEVQDDGKAVIVGAFITYNNVSRKYIARVGVDGSLDTSFDPGTGASHQINVVDIHTAGKILIGGRFVTYNGSSVGRVARVNTDGSLDTSFQTTTGADGEVWAIAVQPDQKILIGGAFQRVNGVGRVRIARLNSDGTLDTTFNAGIGPDLTVRYIELQADGKMLVGGHFRKWNGVNTSRIIRLNSDGSVDNTFSSPLPDNGYVSEIIKDEGDGDIYISGGTRRLLRLNNNGSVQWNVGLTFNSDPNAILLTQDGKIITGGYFTKFGATDRTRLARLNADGTLNAVFDPQPGANKRFLRLALQPDGRIIGVGEFTTYRGHTRNFITRMINDIRIGPFFSLQPETQSVEEGTVFTLTSMAEGQIPVDYQWYKEDGLGTFVALTDGGNISGTTSKDLVFNTITSADAGDYRVIATNPNGSTTSDTVTLTVVPNQAPTFDAINDRNLTEDDPTQTINLSGVSNGATHESGQTLTITATSSDTGIIPNPTVIYTSGDATGTLTFTPVANAHGTATITVTATDDGQTVNGGVTTTVRTFDVIVASVNDTPTLTITPATFIVNEDSGPFTQNAFATFSVGPPNESAQTLTLVCNNSHPGLFSAAPAIDSNTGDLSFTPADDQFGTATVTVYAQDNGGGADTSPTRTFTIVVNAVNDQPNFTLDVSTVNFVEDSGFNQVTIITSTTRGPANETTQKVDRYEITGNTNPGLLTGLEVTSNGILKANTVNGVTGSTVVTIQLVDNGGTAFGGVNTSATQSFTITVGPPNFPPDFDLADNLYTHDEGAGAQSVASFVSNVGPGDVSEAGQTVTFTIAAANPALFQSGPTLTPNGNDYDLSYTPAADAAGSTLVTVTGTDDGPGNAAQNKSFTVVLNEINDEPSFDLNLASGVVGWGGNGDGQLNIPAGLNPSAIATGLGFAIALNPNGTVTGWGSDADGIVSGVSALTGITAISASENNALFVRNDGTVVSLGGDTFGETIVPGGLINVVSVAAGGAHSLALISDGTVVGWGRNNYGQSTPPAGLNNAIQVGIGGNFSMALRSDGTVVGWGQNSVGQLAIPAGLSGVTQIAVGHYDTLALKSDGTVVAWGWNRFGAANVPAGLSGVVAVAMGGEHALALKSDGTVVSWGRNDTGQTTLPAGLANVTAIAGSIFNSFALVNTGLTIDEDAGLQSVAGFAHNISPGPASEAGQSLTFHVSNDNNALFDSQPTISSAGTLQYNPAADANGSANVSVYLMDNGGTANGGDDTSPAKVFTVNINAVNDEPSFTAGGDVSVFRGDGAYDAAWATVLNKGAANENGQTLTFNITGNDNPGLFDSGPAIDGTTGNLSFTPAAGANGTANITVELQDDGGTANGGDDTSAAVTFAINIAGTRVFVDGNPSLSGDTITVPIDLDGAGAENSVSFTLDYDATRLVFDNASAPAGSILVNSGTSGKVGILVALGTGNTFGSGNNNIANLTFTLASTATAGTAPLSFSSSPVLQQVTDAAAGIISGTTYMGANVTLAEGISEGDVAPRPLGNGSLSVADATAIGRFAAGLTPANHGREFQAADTAPLASGGDGVISIADWVQNLRDIAGLDGAPRALSGPTRPVVAPASFSRRPAALTDRRMTVATDGLVAGRSATVRVVLDASGTEAGFSCSLQFDPGSLAYVKATTPTGGMLIVNSQQAANGTIGLVLALPPGNTIPAGTQALVELTFEVAANSTATTLIDLNGSPVVEEITDVFARRLPAVFLGRSFPVQLPAGFEPAGVEIVDGQPRFTFGNKNGAPVTADQLNNLEVHATSNLGGAWTRLDNALQLINGRVHIIDPDAANGLRFYQVRRNSSSGPAQQ